MPVEPAGWPGRGLRAGGAGAEADDRAGLSARLRLLAQVLVAGGFLALAGLAGGRWGCCCCSGWCGWAIWRSFMDGSDGLAGGMAVFGFRAFAWAAGQGGDGAGGGVCGRRRRRRVLVLRYRPARIAVGMPVRCRWASRPVPWAWAGGQRLAPVVSLAGLRALHPGCDGDPAGACCGARRCGGLQHYYQRMLISSNLKINQQCSQNDMVN